MGPVDMKHILYIITTSPPEDLATVISAHDSSETYVRILFTQEGVRCSPVGAYSCVALQKDVLSRNLNISYPTIGYAEMVDLLFQSDLVITI